MREFWQLNVDLFGVPGVEADFEVIQVADAIMQAYGAKRDMYTIKLNSRGLINALLKDLLGDDQTQAQGLIRLLDRMHKLDYAEFAAQADALFSPSQRDAGQSEKLFAFLKTTALDGLPEALAGNESAAELKKLLSMLKNARIDNAVFDPTLMRGFD